MPAIIDHNRRREEIAACAAGLIARGGIDAATVRAVAAEAGYSSKVVSHYFDDKKALLFATYRFAAARSEALTDATQTDAGGASRPDVAAFVKALLPITTIQRENWQVWYAFWAYAISNPAFAGEQQRQVDGSRRRIEELLRLSFRDRFRIKRLEAAEGAKLTDEVAIACEQFN